MVKKKVLLKNLSSFTPEEIAQALKDGVVTAYDLQTNTNGAYSPALKKRVNEILNNLDYPKANINKTPKQEEIKTVENNSSKIDIEPTAKIPQAKSGDDISDETSIEPEPTPIAPYAMNDDVNNYATIDSEPYEKQKMFSHPFSFHGRIRRLEYGISYIIYIVVYFFISIMTTGLEHLPSNEAALYVFLYIIISIPLTWFIWAQGAKRCHDRGNSGWFQIIPFYGLWMLFAPGDEDSNKYGNNPK